MCLPMAAMAGISMAMSAIGAGVQAMGQQQAAQAAATQSLMQGNQAIIQASNSAIQTVQQRQMTDANADLARKAAKDARNRGDAAEQQHRLKVKGLAGRQTAVMAANGVDLGFGSPLDILGDTAELGELDALTIRKNYEQEADRSFAQEAQFNREEAALRTRGDQAMKAGTFSQSMYSVAASSQIAAGKTAALSSLIGGAGSVADKWYNLK